MKKINNLFVAISVLIIILLVFFIGQRIVLEGKESRITKTRGQLKSIQTGLECYYTKYKYYPANLEVLIKEGYLQEKCDVDSWGFKVNYKTTGSKTKEQKEISNNYSMKSNGPDGKEDTEDDIEPPIIKCVYRFPKNNKAPDKVEGK